jgi:hypothetical protein
VSLFVFTAATFDKRSRCVLIVEKKSFWQEDSAVTRAGVSADAVPACTIDTADIGTMAATVIAHCFNMTYLLGLASEPEPSLFSCREMFAKQQAAHHQRNKSI